MSRVLKTATKAISKAFGKKNKTKYTEPEITVNIGDGATFHGDFMVGKLCMYSVEQKRCHHKSIQ